MDPGLCDDKKIAWNEINHVTHELSGLRFFDGVSMRRTHLSAHGDGLQNSPGLTENETPIPSM